jgi:outer membrane lipoprotein-sorting protein
MRSSSLSRFVILGVFLGAVCASAQYRVDQILSKHMKAMGGERVISNLTSIVREAKVDAGGLTGTSTTWILPPNRTRNRIKVGVLDQTTCFEGEFQWTVDANDELTIGDAQARKEGLSEALVDGFAYMFPDTTLQVRFLDREGELGRTFLVLEMRPQKGVPVKLWIDEETWLLAKTEYASSGFTVTREYSHYSPVEGLMVPRHIVMRIPEMQQEFEFDVYTVKINEYVDERLFLIKEPTPRDYIITKCERTDPIPFQFTNDRIYLKGYINGEGPFDFILDSGAAASVINKSLAERLYLAPAGEFKATGIGGFEGMSLVQLDSINLEGVGLYGQVVVAMELPDLLARYEGRPVDLILGYDCLSRFATEIRFSDSTVTFHEAKGFAAPAGYSFLNCSYSSRVPVINGRIEDVGGKFILDTGSGSSIDLSEPFIKRTGIEKGRRLFESELHGFGGRVKIMVGRIRLISLGPYLMENVVVGFAEDARFGVLSMHEYDGIIGNEVLRRFDLIFDYAGDRLAIRPNSSFEEEFRTVKSGMILELSEDGRIIVARNVPSSPADEAQIEPGSELLEVNGQRARELGLGGIREIMRGPEETEVTLKLLEGGEIRVVTLKLRMYY